MAIFKWNTSVFESKIKQSSENAVEAMCDHLVKDVKASMLPGHHVEWKSNKNDGTSHWSSSPGTPPAPDTNILKDSISYAISNGKKSGVGPAASRGAKFIKSVDNVGSPIAMLKEVVGIVGTKDERAESLELGLEFEPRPFLRPAIPRNKGVLRSIFSNVMKVK